MNEDIAKMALGVLGTITTIVVGALVWTMKRQYWDSRRQVLANAAKGNGREVGRFAPSDREVLGRVDTNVQVHMKEASLGTASLASAMERESTAVTNLSQAVTANIAAHTGALQAFSQSMVDLNRSLIKIIEEHGHG